VFLSCEKASGLKNYSMIFNYWTLIPEKNLAIRDKRGNEMK